LSGVAEETATQRRQRNFRRRVDSHVPGSTQ
jgi:hypothetical protein